MRVSSVDRVCLVTDFLTAGDPYSRIGWRKVDAVIRDAKGGVVFRQDGLEFPEFYSDHAVAIIAQKYFRKGENSLKAMIDRVVDTLTRWGLEGDYFGSEEEARCFQLELKHLLLHQYFSFNSPVWFNLGVKDAPDSSSSNGKPQCSACFILEVDDSLDSIREWWNTASLIFAGGSGAGVNLSRLRAQGEPISRGGTSSGPLSFMAAADSIAGSIKSGGTTRRAAKMVVMNIDHPDILDFINCKMIEEKKARLLAAGNFDLSFDGKDWHSIQYQNANNSVRVSDAFMDAVQRNADWQTIFRVTKTPAATYKARDLWNLISHAAWACADPGLQFDDTINRWHTCPADGRIEASNPCSEYMFLNNTACNLASINLIKFRRKNGTFDVPTFRHAVRLIFLAQEIIVGRASYPTEKIEQMSHRYRTIGLGYTNLGALLMLQGLPYDSEEARAYAAAITSLLCGEAYTTSAHIASFKAPFEAFEANRASMLGVINQHQQAAQAINEAAIKDRVLLEAAREVWDVALALGEVNGFRNAQATVLAPTGTISFMMDAQTTGIEPELALVKHKHLVGGGMITLVNELVIQALVNLGYSSHEISGIEEHIKQEGTIEGAPGLKEEHLPVFDCSFVAQNGSRAISPQGHVKMMAAVQPFVSGAISKTVNLPENATVNDVSNIYLDAWRLGLKAIAIYRDGCKQVQPFTMSLEEKTNWRIDVVEEFGLRGLKKRLPKTLVALRHKASIGDVEFYIHTSAYPGSGKLAEIFVDVAKDGSTVAGLLNALCIQISDSLQRGTPLKEIVRKLIGTKFDPSGLVGEKNIQFASSILDYLGRYLGLRFLTAEEQTEVGIAASRGHDNGSSLGNGAPFARSHLHAPICHICGNLMSLTGSCWTCMNCSATSGSCS